MCIYIYIYIREQSNPPTCCVHRCLATEFPAPRLWAGVFGKVWSVERFQRGQEPGFGVTVVLLSSGKRSA